MAALNRARPCLVSIHDVEPATLSLVSKWIEQLRQMHVESITLLVIPGKSWSRQALLQLQAWDKNADIEWAVHGWEHHCPCINGWRHRIHSTLISRNVAEHYLYTPDALIEMIQRSVSWFAKNHLKTPQLYVPPAWAMGSFPRSRWNALPVRAIETLTGIHLTESQRSIALPLLGYEADNSARCTFLRMFNAINRARRNNGAHPVRIAIHPHDGSLRLKEDLLADCIHYGPAISLQAFLDAATSSSIGM